MGNGLRGRSCRINQAAVAVAVAVVAAIAAASHRRGRKTKPGKKNIIELNRNCGCWSFPSLPQRVFRSGDLRKYATATATAIYCPAINGSQ